MEYPPRTDILVYVRPVNSLSVSHDLKMVVSVGASQQRYMPRFLRISSIGMSPVSFDLSPKKDMSFALPPKAATSRSKSSACSKTKSSSVVEQEAIPHEPLLYPQ